MPPWVQPLPPIPKEGDTKAFTVARESILAAMESLNADLTGTPIDQGLVTAAKTGDIQKRRLIIRCAPRWTIYSA